MTRFDADDATERRKLFADAILAHRDRGSAFCTIEAEVDAAEGDVEAAGVASEGDRGDDADGPDDPVAPWVQFADDTFNLDCTDDELTRLEDLLDEFPEFRIERMESPDEAAGTNVRVTARSDANRLAAFLDRTFRTVYERPESYRAWVVAV